MALVYDSVAEEFAVDPPANRNGSGGEEDEEDGVAGAVASFVFHLALAELGVETSFTPAVGKVVGSRHAGALALALLAEFLRGAFDQGFKLRDFRIELIQLVGGWFGRSEFQFAKKHHQTG